MSLLHLAELGGMDELGRMDSPVHRLDARAKVVVTAAFLVAVMSFGRYELSALTPFVLYPVFLLAGGGLPAAVVFRKVLLAAPFAVAVALFNPFLDRVPRMVLGGVELSGGWVSFTSVLLRVGLTVAAAVALLACTGMGRVGAALGRLGVPRVFVAQLLFLYRYLFVLADEGGRMVRAVQVRAPGVRSLGLPFYGGLAGSLLLRAMDRAGRVHRAMAARGFDGVWRTPEVPRWRWADTLFAAGWLAFFAVARCWNLAAELGAWLEGVGR